MCISFGSEGAKKNRNAPTKLNGHIVRFQLHSWTWNGMRWRVCEKEKEIESYGDRTMGQWDSGTARNGHRRNGRMRKEVERTSRCWVCDRLFSRTLTHWYTNTFVYSIRTFLKQMNLSPSIKTIKLTRHTVAAWCMCVNELWLCVCHSRLTIGISISHFTFFHWTVQRATKIQHHINCRPCSVPNTLHKFVFLNVLIVVRVAENYRLIKKCRKRNKHKYSKKSGTVNTALRFITTNQNKNNFHVSAILCFDFSILNLIPN